MKNKNKDEVKDGAINKKISNKHEFCSGLGILERLGIKREKSKKRYGDIFKERRK